MGIPTYFADTAAKRLMNEDGELRTALVDRFGNDTYLPDGSLNRAHLRKAFNNDQAVKDLNALVHPAVYEDARRWRRETVALYTLYEAAIVLELGRQADFAGVIVVHAPEETRRKRVTERDGLTNEQFAARTDKQWSDRQKLAAADYVIDNAGSELLLPQVLRLHARLSDQ